MIYLDPKADLTFKKVFGEHPDLVMNLLNALLPLEEGEEIKEVEYLPAELVPETPLKKNSIVDVRCRDAKGRVFIVEMQMPWSPAYLQRVLFNASKAYVRQLGAGYKYELLQPVYSLSLVNDVFMPDVPEYYHDYRLVHMEHSDKVIDGLRFIFVELPKFTPKTFSEKKMHVLWLRYLTEINENTRKVSEDLLEVPEINKAVELIKESAFSDAQLLGYDAFWDAVRVENTIISDALKKGLTEGREKGLAEGRVKGLAEGRAEGLAEGREKGLAEGIAEGMEKGMAKGKAEGQKEQRISMARQMKTDGLPMEIIIKYTQLTEDDIASL